MFKDPVGQQHFEQYPAHRYDQPRQYQSHVPNISPAPRNSDMYTMMDQSDHFQSSSHSISQNPSPMPFALRSPLPFINDARQQSFGSSYASPTHASNGQYLPSTYSHQLRAQSPSHFPSNFHDSSITSQNVVSPQPNHFAYHSPQNNANVATEPPLVRTRTDSALLANLANLRKQVVTKPLAYQAFHYEPPTAERHTKSTSTPSFQSDLEQVMPSNQPDSLIYRHDPITRQTINRTPDVATSFNYQHAHIEEPFGQCRALSVSSASTASLLPPTTNRASSFEKHISPLMVPSSPHQVPSPQFQPSMLSQPSRSPALVPCVSPPSPVVTSFPSQPPISPSLSPVSIPPAVEAAAAEPVAVNPKKRKSNATPRGSKRQATANSFGVVSRDHTRAMWAALSTPDSPMFENMSSTLKQVFSKDGQDYVCSEQYQTGIVYVLLHIMAFLEPGVMRELLKRVDYTPGPQTALKRGKDITQVFTQVFMPKLPSWPRITLPTEAKLSWMNSPDHAPAEVDFAAPQFAQMIWYRPYRMLFYRLPGSSRVLCCDRSSGPLPPNAIVEPMNQVDLDSLRPPIFVVVNRAFERLFGFSQSEVKGMYCREGRAAMSRFMDLEQYKAISIDGSRKIFSGDSESSHFVTIITAHGHRITALVLHRIKFDQAGFVLKRTWLWVKLPSTRTAAPAAKNISSGTTTAASL